MVWAFYSLNQQHRKLIRGWFLWVNISRAPYMISFSYYLAFLEVNSRSILSTNSRISSSREPGGAKHNKHGCFTLNTVYHQGQIEQFFLLKHLFPRTACFNCAFKLPLADPFVNVATIHIKWKYMQRAPPAKKPWSLSPSLSETPESVELWLMLATWQDYTRRWRRLPKPFPPFFLFAL